MSLSDISLSEILPLSDDVDGALSVFDSELSDISELLLEDVEGALSVIDDELSDISLLLLAQPLNSSAAAQSIINFFIMVLLLDLISATILLQIRGNINRFSMIQNVPQSQRIYSAKA